MLLRHWSREDAIGDDSAHEPTWLVNLLHQFPHFDAKLHAVSQHLGSQLIVSLYVCLNDEFPSAQNPCL